MVFLNFIRFFGQFVQSLPLNRIGKIALQFEVVICKSELFFI